MVKYLLLCLIFLVSINLGFSQGKGINELCAVGTSECTGTLKCVPSKSDTAKFGGFSKEGICLQPIAEGQPCTKKSLRTICQTGLACVALTGSQMTDGTGTCKKLSDLNSGEILLVVGLPHPVASNPFSGCKYLPGNYFYDDSTTEQCCGITRSIPDPSKPDQNISAPKYCDLVNQGEPKAVNNPIFCAKNKFGEPAVWESQNVPLNAGTAATPGKCLAPPPSDTNLILGPDPEYTWDETKCQATFSPQELQSRVGLISNWNGLGAGEFRYWFTSLPTAQEPFYRVGDEAFMLAYIWLFKNTNVNSFNGVNLEAKGVADQLYQVFDKYYSKSYRDAFALMNQLDKMKTCINLQGSIGFQLRYQIDDLLEEGLLGSIRAYQCGGVGNMDATNLNCTSDQNIFFRNAFNKLFNATQPEEDVCMEPHTCPFKCSIQIHVHNWDDKNRNDFIVETVKNSEHVDLGDFFGGPYHEVGVNGLVDPPINTAWAPMLLQADDVNGLLATINGRNKDFPPVVLPTNNGREPDFNWQIIIDPARLNDAFPAQDNIPGLSFLHYNAKMPFFSEEDKAYYLLHGRPPGTTAKEASEYWNGPLTVAGEAVRIMEQFSTSDNVSDVIPLQKRRQLRKALHQFIVPYRLARLMQYYEKKLEAVQKEKVCLLDKIKLLAKASGVDVNAPNFDPVQVQLTGNGPGCGDSANDKGKNGNSLTNLDSNSLELANADPGLKAKSNKLGNNINGPQGNFEGIAFDPNFQNLKGGKIGTSTVSMSTLHGSSSLNNATRSTAANAVKESSRKQKETSLLMHKKLIEENANHPSVVAQEKMNELGSQLFPQNRTNSVASSGHRGGLHGGLENTSPEASGSGGATQGESTPGTTSPEKKWGVLPPAAIEKIKIGGGMGKKPGDMMGSGQASYTGLAPADEEQILQNIRAEDVATNEDDSLWKKLSKAYVKSYTKLFAPRNRN